MSERILTPTPNRSERLGRIGERLRRFSRSERAVRARVLLKALAGGSRGDYGSLTPGIPAWREKWAASPGKRVLFYARIDFGGSFFQWARAINEHTPYAARMVTTHVHEYGYPLDLVFPYARLRRTGIRGLFQEADIIHVKDELLQQNRLDGLTTRFLRRLDKPLVFTHYGGNARKQKDDSTYRDFVRGMFAKRVALTPDLCYEWFDGHFVPHAMDLGRYDYSWRPSLCVAHSPSSPTRKGTDDFLLAMERLDDLDLELELIHNVSHDECVARKRKCGLFFDQAGREQPKHLGVTDVIGWYGNSALEAAAFGIPTIAHLSEQAFDGAARGGVDVRQDCAIINTPRDANGMAEVIRGFFQRTDDEKRELSLRTRRWVESFHGGEFVARRLARVYRDAA